MRQWILAAVLAGLIWTPLFSTDQSSDGKVRVCPVGEPESACVVRD